MWRKILTVVAIIILLTGIGFLLFPTVSNFIGQQRANNVIEEYSETLDHVIKEDEPEAAKELGITAKSFEEALEKGEIDEEGYPVNSEGVRTYSYTVSFEYDLDRLYSDSKEYNASIFHHQGTVDTINYEKAALDMSRYGLNNLYGYLSAPSIDLYLPVYLGANDSMMSYGAAHLSGTSLYYTIGLGFGMVLAYWLINGCCKNDENNSLGESFVLVMTVVTLFGSFMVFEYYLENIKLVLAKDGIIPFQWRNNVSTFLMFGLPFPFYYSRKKWAVSFIGWAGYLALLLGGSRGGLLFGTVEMGLCVLLTLIFDKKHRRHNLIVLGAIAVVLAAFGRRLVPFFRYTLERIVDYKENKTRFGLFERATEDFRANRVFGSGLANWNNRDIHPSKRGALCWYHSAPFQIIGSFGIVGVVCFTLRFVTRVWVIVSRVNHFTLTMAVSFLGITMMSLVNPGEFCPLPYELITTMIFILLEKTPQAIAVKTPRFVRRRRRLKNLRG